MRRHLFPVPLLMTLGTVVAVEQPPVAGTGTDLRFVYALGPDRYSITSPAPGVAHDGHWDRAQGVRLDLLRAMAPLGLGVSLGGQQNQEDHRGDRLGYQAVTGRVNLGVALAPADRVQIEILPFAGYGLSELDYVSGGVPGSRRDRDDFFEYGLNVNASLTTSGGLQFGGGVGYLVNESSYDLTPSTAGAVTVDQQGPVYSVFIGTRR